MSFTNNSDNIFPTGLLITAKDNPTKQLKIMKYYQRIYYCSIVGQETGKQLAYFEKELIAPVPHQ